MILALLLAGGLLLAAGRELASGAPEATDGPQGNGVQESGALGEGASGSGPQESGALEEASGSGPRESGAPGEGVSGSGMRESGAPGEEVSGSGTQEAGVPRESARKSGLPVRRIFGDLSADAIEAVELEYRAGNGLVSLSPPDQKIQREFLENLFRLEGEACEQPDEDSVCSFSLYRPDQDWIFVAVYAGGCLYRSDTKTCFRVGTDLREQVMDPYLSAATEALLSRVAAEKMRQTIRGVLREEGSTLVSLSLAQPQGLSCCLFETSAGIGSEFHVLCAGAWEGKELPVRHYVLPLNDAENSTINQLSSDSRIQGEDMDFDGSPDLLIYVASNGGSGGIFEHYRLLRWDDAAEEFVYFPSFPYWVNQLEPERQRVICRGRLGVCYLYTEVYSVVDGAYRLTQELVVEWVPRGETEEWGITVSYYEGEELKRTIDVSGLTNEEIDERVSEQIPEWDAGPAVFL